MKMRRYLSYLLCTALCIAVVILTWPMEPSALDVLILPMSRFSGSLQSEYECDGLSLPRNGNEYFSSVIGSVFRTMKTRVRVPFEVSLGLAWLDHINITFCDRPGKFIIRAKGKVIRRRYLFSTKAEMVEKTLEIAKLPPSQTTARLLASASSGTHFWKEKIHFAQRYQLYLVGAAFRPIPSIGFNIPTTTSELQKYKLWLKQMVGSENRFRDGWGGMIRLELVKKHNTVRLISSSAGPDRKWGTADDMMLERDAETGKIVEKHGISNGALLPI